MGDDIEFFIQRLAEREAKIADLERRLARQRGCVCPPTSEITCQGALCPRRKYESVT